MKEESDNRSTEVGHLPKEIAKQVSDALKQGQVQITATVLVETGHGAKGGKGMELPIKVELLADNIQLLRRIKQKLAKKVEILCIK